jgi:hypothetical protein
LTYSLLFALILAAILTAGEVACRHYANPYAYKDRWMKAHAPEVETLILGSSVNYYGINPSLLPGKTFNLAGVSQNFEYDYLLLRHYGRRLTSLRRIVLSVGYTSFTDAPLEESGEWMYAQGYRIYMGIDRNPMLSRYSLEIANLNGYAGKLRNMIAGENSIICDSLGHGTAMSSTNRSKKWLDDIHTTVARHTAVDFSHVAYNKAYLDSILDYAERRSIEVVLLSTPKHHLYRDAMPLQQRRLTVSLTDSIVDSRSVVRIDLTDDPRFTDDDFYDGDHLTADNGAYKLSLLLRSLLPPL